MATRIERGLTLYRNSYNSIGGVDIKCVIAGATFGNIQAISYSIVREKAPVYTMGSPECRSYARGKRGITGTLMFIMFDDHALLNHMAFTRQGEFVTGNDEIRPYGSRWVEQEETVIEELRKNGLDLSGWADGVKQAAIDGAITGAIKGGLKGLPGGLGGVVGGALKGAGTGALTGSAKKVAKNVGSAIFDYAWYGPGYTSTQRIEINDVWKVALHNVNTEGFVGDFIEGANPAEGGWNRDFAWYSDQLPSFNIVLTGVNEDGAAATMSILGVEILNEGYGISIDDLISEQQMTYVARAIARWRPLHSDKLFANKNKASSLLTSIKTN